MLLWGPLREKGRELEAPGACWGSGSGSHRSPETVRCAGRVLCPGCFAVCCRPSAEADTALCSVSHRVDLLRLILSSCSWEEMGRKGVYSGQGWGERRLQ